jgi:hypothetical protein
MSSYINASSDAMPAVVGINGRKILNNFIIEPLFVGAAGYLLSKYLSGDSSIQNVSVLGYNVDGPVATGTVVAVGEVAGQFLNATTNNILNTYLPQVALIGNAVVPAVSCGVGSSLFYNLAVNDAAVSANSVFGPFVNGVLSNVVGSYAYEKARPWIPV